MYTLRKKILKWLSSKGHVSQTETINLFLVADYLEEYREEVIKEVKEALLKQMAPMLHENNYPTSAVPHSVILSLPAIMQMSKP